MSKVVTCPKCHGTKKLDDKKGYCDLCGGDGFLEIGRKPILRTPPEPDGPPKKENTER